MISNKYIILEKIGNGSFGNIFKGENIRTKEKVAIKMCSVDNKYNLLKPILSRLCEIYIDSPMIITSEGTYTSFNTYNISKLLNTNAYDGFSVN
jgi:serine/threonine protein kinase